MPHNPLDVPGEIFDLALMNPNPTSSKTKNGAVYRVSFECERELWDLFMAANTAGMLIAAKGTVVGDDPALHEVRESEPEACRQYGEHARQLKLSSFFRNPKVWELAGRPADLEHWTSRQRSVLTGQFSEIDAHGVGRCVACHVRRVSQGSGTAAKPPYFMVPMTHTEHSIQHQSGEALALREFRPEVFLGSAPSQDVDVARHWFEVEAVKNAANWAWGALRDRHMREDSWTKVPPERLREFCVVNEIPLTTLPGIYRADE